MRRDIGEIFEQVEQAARKDDDLETQWLKILNITEQASSSELVDLDIHADAEKITEQVHKIITEYPIPKALTFLYFGLFDRDLLGHESVGFYISGGTSDNPKEALTNGSLDYFPERRFIHSVVLDAIKHEELKKAEPKEVFSYALVFGAAAILSKEVSKLLCLKTSVYVGFDSGDYSLIQFLRINGTSSF